MKTTLIALLALGMCLPLAGADKGKPAAGREAANKAYAEGRYDDAIRLANQRQLGLPAKQVVLPSA